MSTICNDEKCSSIIKKSFVLCTRSYVLFLANTLTDFFIHKFGVLSCFVEPICRKSTILKLLIWQRSYCNDFLHICISNETTFLYHRTSWDAVSFEQLFKNIVETLHDVCKNDVNSRFYFVTAKVYATAYVSSEVRNVL